jgi:plastocyanin
MNPMLLALCLGLLSPGAAAPGAAPKPAGKVYVVTIDKLAFGAVPKGLHAGDVIEWVNRDIFEHTVTARNGKFDVDIAPGKTARTVLERGSIPFYCKFHPGMTGALEVE